MTNTRNGPSETVYARNFHRGSLRSPPTITRYITRLNRVLPAARGVFGRRLAPLRPNESKQRCPQRARDTLEQKNTWCAGKCEVKSVFVNEQ